ncbi:MAG TPA: hypothetical protein PLS49_00815 [Candidatus Woesebacteria bacterium]|nr:hypothetical protein [Candidatus Woesebacteria bacterium]
MENQNKKQLYIIGGVILVLVAAIAFMMFKGKNNQETAEKESVFKESEEEILPVDSSVKVTIKGNTEGVITVSGIPEGTNQIEYQLTYNKKNLVDGEGLQDGIFGRIDVKNQTEVEEDITFGTCSSGVCRYHNIDGPVSGSFLFTGSYGKRILEQKFDLEE